MTIVRLSVGAAPVRLVSIVHGTDIAELRALICAAFAIPTQQGTAPVALIAGIGVAIAAMASYAVTRRLRASGASETQSLLRGTSYGTTREGDNMV